MKRKVGTNMLHDNPPGKGRPPVLDSIDTSAPQYQNLLAAVITLRSTLTPRFKSFNRAPEAAQKDWLARDPLLRETLRLIGDANSISVDLGGAA